MVRKGDKGNIIECTGISNDLFEDTIIFFCPTSAPPAGFPSARSVKKNTLKTFIPAL